MQPPCLQATTLIIYLWAGLSVLFCCVYGLSGKIGSVRPFRIVYIICTYDSGKHNSRLSHREAESVVKQQYLLASEL